MFRIFDGDLRHEGIGATFETEIAPRYSSAKRG